MSEKPTRPVHFIIDWDGTLTKKDTLHLVAKVAYDKHFLPLHDRNEHTYQPPATSWGEVGRKYMARYNEHKDQYRPSTNDRTTLAEERKWLASLKEIERFGAQTAEQTGLFSRVTRRGVESGGSDALFTKQLELRQGWDEVIRQGMNKSGNKVSILSVNWSAKFIRAALQAGVKELAATSRQFDRPGLMRFVRDELVIDANEVQGLDDADGSSGRLERPQPELDVRTSADKLLRMPSRCKTKLDIAEDRAVDDYAHLVVYIGDSETDLECLLAADVGICIQDKFMGSGQAALASTFERLDVPISPVQNWTLDQIGRTCVWSARDFTEILTVLQSQGLCSEPKITDK